MSRRVYHVRFSLGPEPLPHRVLMAAIVAFAVGSTVLGAFLTLATQVVDRARSRPDPGVTAPPEPPPPPPVVSKTTQFDPQSYSWVPIDQPGPGRWYDSKAGQFRMGARSE